MECHIFPEIAGDVTFDTDVRYWVMSGQDVNPAVLRLPDTAATDVKILAESLRSPPLTEKGSSGHNRDVEIKPRTCG
jgi:hypothetical protein